MPTILYRPHTYKLDISLLATSALPASSRFLAAISLFLRLYYRFRAFFVVGASVPESDYNLSVFFFFTRSATCDRIRTLLSTPTPNLSLFTAFSASNGEQPAECLRLFQVILIDVSRETRIFLAIFSIIRAIHYSS